MVSLARFSQLRYSMKNSDKAGRNMAQKQELPVKSL
jgi:hypothetical protein